LRTLISIDIPSTDAHGDLPTRQRKAPAEFGVSRERVRQIEVRAFEKVQSAVKARSPGRNRPVRARK
jgi:RNA polymerase sigma-32 factor